MILYLQIHDTKNLSKPIESTVQRVNINVYNFKKRIRGSQDERQNAKKQSNCTTIIPDKGICLLTKIIHLKMFKVLPVYKANE